MRLRVDTCWFECEIRSGGALLLEAQQHLLIVTSQIIKGHPHEEK